jgi:hypothetical protein
VTVHFTVKPKTGSLGRPTIDSELTTAPQALILCVLDAITGLQLAPPDAHEGRATFVYDFKPSR